MSDKRQGPRLRSLKGGRILIGKTESIDCVVRDLSDSGARLRFPAMIGVPESFDLALTADHIRIPARKAWRRGNEVGIRFSRPRTEAKKNAA